MANTTKARMEKIYLAAGGKQVTYGKQKSAVPVWNFGWIPPHARTDAHQAEHHRATARMPRFSIRGKSLSDDTDSALLYKLWAHPDVIATNGMAYPGNRQVTGSCVGVGGGNAIYTLACVEAITKREPELAKFLFWPLPYGRSRYYGGSRSPGEGSNGSTFAKAAEEDGILRADHPGLPKYTTDDMLCYGRSVELAWSDGDASQTMNLLPESRQHPVKTTAQCADHDDVREAIVNGFTCTAASMYAHNGGKVQGTPPVLLAKRSGSWSHQMSIIGWLLHPQFGELFYLMNTWGKQAHGIDPFGAPNGGVWITSADCDYICRDEMYAFSQFQGFPAPRPDVIPWIF